MSGKVINLLNVRDIEQMKLFGKIPIFYQWVIEGYIICNRNNSNGKQCIKQLCFWGNEHVVNKQNKVMYFPHWINSDFIKIKDIIFIKIDF